MSDVPPSHRVEPDAAFADRLETMLVERLGRDQGSTPTRDHLTPVNPPTATGRREESTGEHLTQIELGPYVAPLRPAHRRPVRLALGAVAAAGLLVALTAIVRFEDESAPADLPPTTADGPVTTVDGQQTTGEPPPTSGAEPTTTTVAPVAQPTPFEGAWVSTDTDGSSQMMEITRTAGEDAGDDHEVVVLDDRATICAHVASTMSGSGRLDAEGALVLPQPVLTCDDGSVPLEIVPPLSEQLRNYTLVHDPGTEELVDSLGVVWRRPDADDDPASTTPRLSWPQSTLAEVNAAQALADAGDPGSAWQVDPLLAEHGEPGEAEIFTRFLREELGWEEFRWADFEGYGIAEGAYEEVVFIRCAPGLPNPVFPDHPVGGGCAPTIDDRRYETVMIGATQPAQRGASGIWVVSEWSTGASVEQIAPASDDEMAALLQTFLEARVAGTAAERYLRPGDEVPLLYATTTGAPYERFEYAVGDPEWPTGAREVVVKLFAEIAATEVEQVFELRRDLAGRLLLEYSHERLDRAATIENGVAMPLPYSFLEGEVTFAAAQPWREGIWSAQHSPTLTTLTLDGPVEGLSGWFALAADLSPAHADCEPGPAPADVDDLARILRADPDLEVSEPVTTRIAGTDALTIDVIAVEGAETCDWWGAPMVLTNRAEDVVDISDPEIPRGLPLAPGERMRLHLVDMPGGSAGILAVAIVASDEHFEQVLAEATPILESIELHTP